MLRWIAGSLAVALFVLCSLCVWEWFHGERLGFVRSRPVQSKAAPGSAGEREAVVIYVLGSGFGPWWHIVVYDDGSVLDERSERAPRRLEGTLGRDAALALARRVTAAIERPEVRREERAEDGVWSSLEARVGDTWTRDTAHGMFPGGVYTRFFFGWRGFSEHPWSRFFDAMMEVTTLPLRDVHPAPPDAR